MFGFSNFSIPDFDLDLEADAEAEVDAGAEAIPKDGSLQVIHQAAILRGSEAQLLIFRLSR